MTASRVLDGVSILEWSGSALGLLGAALLASNTKLSSIGWVFFLAANFAMLGFSHGIRRYGLFAQQLGFTLTSVLGIVRSDLLLPLMKLFN